MIRKSIYWLIFTSWYYTLNAQHIGMPYLPGFEHYCLLSCFAGDIQIANVGCYAAPCLPSYLCGDEHKRLPFNDTEIEYILHRHNEIRNATSATDMVVMSYDKELEFLASCWSNQCMESTIPSLGRDDCRATTTFSENGQNHWSNASTDKDVDWSDIRHVDEAIKYWHSQKNFIDSNIIKSYKHHKNELYDFYTQMVWADSYLIGCGRTRFSADKYIGVNIVCNYGPAGNIEKMPVYTEGDKPCSRYPNMTVNDKYSGLCGKIRPSSEDNYEPYFVLDAVKTNMNFLLLSATVMLNIFMLFCNR